MRCFALWLACRKLGDWDSELFCVHITCNHTLDASTVDCVLKAAAWTLSTH